MATYTVTYVANKENVSSLPASHVTNNSGYVYITSKSPECSTILSSEPSYTITFEANGVNSLGTISKQADYVLGYKFAGWKDANGTSYESGKNYKLSSNLTLYAQWTEANFHRIVAPKIVLGITQEVKERTVIFNAAANNAICDIDKYTHEVTFDYEVLGWYRSASGGTANSAVASEGIFYPTADTTLYARQSIISTVDTIQIPEAKKLNQYLSKRIYFNGNGGTLPRLEAEGLANVSYSFIGWNSSFTEDSTDVDVYDTKYDPGENWKITTDTVLYPVFNYSTDNIFSLQLPRQEECFKPGYSLLGWSTNPIASSETYEPGQIINVQEENITLYAIWGANTLTINYYAPEATSAYYQNIPIRDFNSPVFTKTYTINETATIPNSIDDSNLKLEREGYESAKIWKSKDKSLSFTDNQRISTIDMADLFNKDFNANKSSIINLYLSWTPCSYVLYLNNNKKTNNQTYSMSVTFGSPYDSTDNIFDPNDYPKLHRSNWITNKILNIEYPFNGWWILDHEPSITIEPLINGTLITPQKIVDIPYSHTAYAVWNTLDDNNLLYIEPNGGSWFNSKTGKYETKSSYVDSKYLQIRSLSPPSRKGYTFVGWAQSAKYPSYEDLRFETCWLDNTFIENSLFINAKKETLPQSWNKAILDRIEDTSAGYFYTINITSEFDNINQCYGGFCSLYSPLDDYEEKQSYIHTFLANVPVGESLKYQSNLLSNNKVRFSWLTNPWGEGEWKVYAYQVVCEPGFSEQGVFPFGAVTIATKENNNMPVVWKIGTNQITRNPDQPQLLAGGPLDDTLYAQWVITPGIHRCVPNRVSGQPNQWAKGVPYLFINNEWRQAVPYIFDGEKWQLNS